MHSMRPHSRRISLALLPCLALLAACSTVSEMKVTDYLTPFRIDVNQGNYVTQEMVAQLRPGQTKDQVRFILGSPLIVDAFHGGDRWDYLYRFQPGKGEAQTRRLIVYFTDSKLAKVGGDVTGGDAAAAASSSVADAPKVIDLGAAPAASADKK